MGKPRSTGKTRLNLSPYDILLFRALEEGRCISIRQAAQFIWAHENAARRRLRQLELAGLVVRRYDPFARESIITPTATALAVLRTHDLLLPEQESWSPRLRQQSIRHVVHEVAVNEIRFALDQACRHHPTIRLLSCRCGPKLFDQVLVGNRHVHVFPDRYLRLSVNGQVLHAQIEVDRGTRPICARSRERKDMLKQLSAYDRYEASFRARHDGQTFAVITTTPDMERAVAIVEAMLSDGARRRGITAGGRLHYYVDFSAFIADPLGPVLRPERTLAEVLTFLAKVPPDQTLGEALARYPDVCSHLPPGQLQQPYWKGRSNGKPVRDSQLRDAVLAALDKAKRLPRVSMSDLPRLLDEN